jgi:hypothetical protein
MATFNKVLLIPWVVGGIKNIFNVIYSSQMNRGKLHQSLIIWHNSREKLNAKLSLTQQDRQCTCNVTLKHFRVAIGAVEMQ